MRSWINYIVEWWMDCNCLIVVFILKLCKLAKITSSKEYHQRERAILLNIAKWLLNRISLDTKFTDMMYKEQIINRELLLSWELKIFLFNCDLDTKNLLVQLQHTNRIQSVNHSESQTYN